MTTLSEGDLRLTVPDPANGRQFDDAQHGLSHCMKAVDWVVDLPERTCFVEVKDPKPLVPENSARAIALCRAFWRES